MFSFHGKWRAWVVVALLFLFMAINYADKAVIGFLQQIENVAVARVIPCCTGVGAGHAALRPGILRVAGGRQADFARVALVCECGVG